METSATINSEEEKIIKDVAALEPAPQAGVEGGLESADAEEAEDEESEYLPFPNARVVRIIKQSFKKEHQIKRDVKVAANILLGEILADIAQSMDAEEYFTLSIEHFNKAARKYREIALNQKRIRRIQKILEKQRAELDEIVTEIELEANPEASLTPGQMAGRPENSSY